MKWREEQHKTKTMASAHKVDCQVLSTKEVNIEIR